MAQGARDEAHRRHVRNLLRRGAGPGRRALDPGARLPALPGRQRAARAADRGGRRGGRRTRPAPSTRAFPPASDGQRRRVSAGRLRGRDAPAGAGRPLRRRAQSRLPPAGLRRRRARAVRLLSRPLHRDRCVGARLHGPGVEHTIPRRPVPGPLGGRAQALCAAADAGFRRGLDPSRGRSIPRSPSLVTLRCA